MENEQIVSIESGLNDDFYACLIEQADLVDDVILLEQSGAENYADIEENILEQVLENDMIDAMNEQAQEDFMFEQAQEDAMFEDMIEQAQEDAMFEQAQEDAMFEDMIEQGQEDAMFEQAQEDAMIEQAQEDAMSIGPYNLAKPDRQSDSWIAIYNDFSSKSSEDFKSLEINNLLCFIHKKFEKTSKSGKTAYYSYSIIDENSNPSILRLGKHYCKSAELEHWVSWEYDTLEIKEQHYFTQHHQNSKSYKFERTFIYPIDYSFASFVPLNKYNPFNFSFKKLNFMNKNNISSCGDKLSRVKIFVTKDIFLELSVFDFENNIIPLLKELDNSVSFNDFVIKIHLGQSVKYLEIIKKELSNRKNNYALISANNIIENMKKSLEKLYKFLPQSVKNSPDSDYTVLISSFDALVNNINNRNNVN